MQGVSEHGAAAMRPEFYVRDSHDQSHLRRPCPNATRRSWAIKPSCDRSDRYNWVSPSCCCWWSV